MSVTSVIRAAVPLDGAGSEGFSVEPPRRPAEARRRYGANGNVDLEERSGARFRARASRTKAVIGEANPAIRNGGHEVSHYCCNIFSGGAVSFIPYLVLLYVLLSENIIWLSFYLRRDWYESAETCSTHSTDPLRYTPIYTTYRSTSKTRTLLRCHPRE